MLGTSFKEYSEIYNLYLSNNICVNVVNSDPTLVLSGQIQDFCTLNLDCESLENGILKFGIQTATVSFVEVFREALVKFYIFFNTKLDSISLK